MTDTFAGLSARFVADRHRLFAYIHAMVRSRHVAEDLFQEVYLSLVRTTERGEPIADLQAWCRGVARNLALRHWQEQKQRKESPSAELLDNIEQSFAEGASTDQDDLLQALAECRSALPGMVVQLLDLKYVHELPMREIAARTRRSERAVISALALIRRRLMDCIAGRLGSQTHV